MVAPQCHATRYLNHLSIKLIEECSTHLFPRDGGGPGHCLELALDGLPPVGQRLDARNHALPLTVQHRGTLLNLLKKSQSSETIDI